MAKYLIHTCKQRLWYVQDYLIPSMTEQGIDPDNISVYLDKDEEGCLVSCMKAFLSVPNDDSGTWHLQDDVIICSDFKERTEKYDCGIVCGYCYTGDDRQRYVGYVDKRVIWYSFPCIRIPNKIAHGCGSWYFRHVVNNHEYYMWIKAKKYDDSIFEIFLLDYCPEDLRVLNLQPNLVDHVDYLIGGSLVNSSRPEKETHAVYFEEKYLIEKLKNSLTTK